MLEALAVAEQFAEGTATRAHLARASAALKQHHAERVVRAPLYTPHIRSVPAWHATREAVVRATHEGTNLCAWSSARRPDGGGSFPTEELAAQGELVREIFGSSLRPLEPHPFSPAVRALAQATLDACTTPRFTLDPERLSVLADAVEEAGGGDALLGHLRSPGPHVRGCFALDALRGSAGR
jgi:hypothetical protein